MKAADEKPPEAPDVEMDAGDYCEAQVKRAKTIMGLDICVLEAQDDVYDKTLGTPTIRVETSGENATTDEDVVARSANQLSIYGAVSRWCEDLPEKIPGETSSHVDKSISREDDQLSKKLNPQELHSLVRNPMRTEGAVGHSLHDHLRRFKRLDPEDQCRKIYE